MGIRERLDAAIEGRRLADHPFYQAWREGTLPVDALAEYAAEYGTFIAAIPDGWQTVGNAEHAAEEREHAGLWRRFAAHFGRDVGHPRIAEVEALLETAARLFGDPASAWGALYAFEVQQPLTSEEKLKGLVEHYGFGGNEPSAEYFRVHAGDYHEADDIVTALDARMEDRAVAACGEMAGALWDALTGVLDAE